MAFIAFVASLAFGERASLSGGGAAAKRDSFWLFVVLLAGAAALAYGRAASAPFLFDDYVHLTNAATESLSGVLRRTLVEHPAGGDLFFRPLGSLYYWFNFRWAGYSPEAWHVCNLVIHFVNTVLVLRLCRSLGCGAIPALAGALLFAWHGTHVEAVCWLAAAFDLLATLFGLAALILIVEGRGVFVNAAIIVWGAAACLSKESAYCLPLLALAIAFFEQRRQRRRVLQGAILVAIACGAVFLYRLWYLAGIGGYRAASGKPLVATANALGIAQAFLLRLWAILFVPINWSVRPEVWLQAAAVVMLAAVAVAISRARVREFSRAYAALCFTACAGAPAFAMLLIGTDLAGSRVLYLPSVGFSLLIAELAAKLEPRGVAVTLVSSLLVFQLAALEHNETIWVRVAGTARRACLATAEMLERDPQGSVYAYDLPKLLDGVYFLQNGFPECVAITGGIDKSRVSAGETPPTGNAAGHVISWNEKAGRLEVLK